MNFATFCRKPASFLTKRNIVELRRIFESAFVSIFSKFRNFMRMFQRKFERQFKKIREISKEVFSKFQRMLQIFEACFEVLNSAAKFSRLYKVQINALHEQFHLRQRGIMTFTWQRVLYKCHLQ